jgi:excisionase family DNA binding protein
MHAHSENKGRQAPLKRAISVREFGQQYGFGRTKTYSLIKAGKLPSLKVGGKRLIRVDDAEELITGDAK